MNASSIQQVLDVSLAPKNTLDTFYSSDSAFKVMLRDIVSGHYSEPQLFIWGQSGTGKTHLLQALCHAALHAQQRAMYIPFKEVISFGGSCLDELDVLDLVCLDDVQAIAGDFAWENALFNTINQLRTSGTAIIIASELSSANQIFELPDLNSRSVWGPVFKLPVLMEDDLIMAISLHAQARGLMLAEDVSRYLLTHYPRNLSFLVDVIGKLDEASLQEQSKITIPFLKKVLAAN